MKMNNGEEKTGEETHMVDHLVNISDIRRIKQRAANFCVHLPSIASKNWGNKFKDWA